MTWRSWNPGC